MADNSAVALLATEEDEDHTLDCAKSKRQDANCIGACRVAWANSATTYKRVVLSSVQIATWFCLLVIVAFQPHRSTLSKEGFPAATIGMNTLYILQPTLGGTIQSALGGLVGSFWASLLYITLNTIFPGGNHCVYDAVTGGYGDYSFKYVETSECLAESNCFSASAKAAQRCCAADYHATIACITVTAIYVFCFLVFKVDGTVRFFAIGNYCFYMMTFLNPYGSNLKPLDIHGPALGGFILYCIAAVIAVLTMALPCPKTASSRIRRKTEETVKSVFDLKRRVLAYTAGDKPCLEIYTIQSQLKKLDRTTDEIKALSQDAWFESCGSNKIWTLTNDLAVLLDKVVDTFSPLVSVVMQEQFEQSHKDIMKDVEKPLEIAINTVEKLAISVSAARLSGNVDDASLRELLNSCKATVKDASESIVHAAKRVIPGECVSISTEGEHYLVYTTCLTKRLIEAKTLDMLDNPAYAPCYKELINHVKSIFNIDRQHLKWAARTSLALCLAFYFGYWGIGICHKTDTDCAPLIAKYNGNIAFSVVVFMVPSHGSTISAALNRISAVVLSTFVGQVFWYFFGWCNDAARAETVIATWMIVFVGVYIGFGGGDNAAIGTRLAATSISMLWGLCSDRYSTYGTYSGYFHGLIDVIFGVAVLSAIDIMFGDAPAHNRALEQVNVVIKEYLECLTAYLTTDLGKDDLLAKAQKIKGDIAAAKDLGDAAKFEPAFWRQPWLSGLFNNVIDAYSGFLNDLCNLAEQNSSRKQECMMQYESFKPLSRRIIYLAQKTNAVVEGALQRNNTVDASEECITMGRHSVLLQELRNEMNALIKNGKLPHVETASGESLETRQSVITCTLMAMLQAHEATQQTISSYGQG